MQHHYIQKILTKGEVNMIYQCTIDNTIVEIITKSLSQLKYVKFTIAVGINLDDSSKPKKGYTKIGKSTLPLKQKNIITHDIH